MRALQLFVILIRCKMNSFGLWKISDDRIVWPQLLSHLSVAVADGRFLVAIRPQLFGYHPITNDI